MRPAAWAAYPSPVRLAITFGLLALSGCGSCGCGAESLRVEEPFPHVRCLAADAPDPDRGGTLGDVTVRIEDRVAFVEGPEPPVRFAAFAGPAPGRADLSGGLSAIAEAGVSFAVVLGDFGDDPEALGATLRKTARILAAISRTANGLVT